MSVPWTGTAHQHDHSTLTTTPASTTGTVTSWTDYRQCACGHLIPVAVTELSSPVPAQRRELQVLHAPMAEPEPEAGR
jgi:hypothetical protein